MIHSITDKFNLLFIDFNISQNVQLQSPSPANNVFKKSMLQMSCEHLVLPAQDTTLVNICASLIMSAWSVI